MVAGNLDQASFGNRYGRCQRHPNLGSHSSHSTSDSVVEEKQKCRSTRFTAPPRNSFAPNELRTLALHPARHCIRTRILVDDGRVARRAYTCTYRDLLSKSCGVETKTARPFEKVGLFSFNKSYLS